SFTVGMHRAARVWPSMRKTPSLLGTGSGDRRGEDRQLRKRNAQRLLLDGNAGALLVNRSEQQLLAALDLGPLWIPIERELLFNQSPRWFFIQRSCRERLRCKHLGRPY